jgi:hypothetical protein
MSEIGYLALPPHVEQMDAHSCWAASMESWLAASPGRTRVFQEELYLRMYDVPGALAPDGMLTIKGAKALGDMFKMKGKAFPKNNLKKLTGKFLMDRLVKSGYLYMAFYYYNLPGHAVVVYGMVNDSESGNELILAMDPLDTSAYTNYALEDYKVGAKQFFVAWA